jgi:hypothetical protein
LNIGISKGRSPAFLSPDEDIPRLGENVPTPAYGTSRKPLDNGYVVMPDEGGVALGHQYQLDEIERAIGEYLKV